MADLLRRFESWLQTASAGQHFTYWTGHIAYELATAREPLRSGIAVVKDTAMSYERSGDIALVQRRRGLNVWDYEAVKLKDRRGRRGYG
ncbi:hypothetical protein WDZ92_34040 [Nostoc sp. NIES-2111]